MKLVVPPEKGTNGSNGVHGGAGHKPPRPSPEPSLLDCGEHGTKTWLGDVVCAACGEVFLCVKDLNSKDQEGRSNGTFPTAPDSGMCHCGVRLFPERDAEGKMVSADFSARPACRECAEAHAKTKKEEEESR